MNGSQSSCPGVLLVCPCDGHVISQNGNMVVIEEGEIRIHSLSQDKGLLRNFTHAQCCRNSSDLSDNRTFFMNVRQKMSECRTKCPTENIKISNWLMKRSETQVTIKDNNEDLCHFAVFVDTRIAL